jgi:hypothetical protein
MNVEANLFVADAKFNVFAPNLVLVSKQAITRSFPQIPSHLCKRRNIQRWAAIPLKCLMWK